MFGELFVGKQLIYQVKRVRINRRIVLGKKKETEMNDNTNFTEGKIIGPLMRFAMPVMFALFLQAMYGAVDLFVVGKFATSEDVSAQAISRPHIKEPGGSYICVRAL